MVTMTSLPAERRRPGRRRPLDALLWLARPLLLISFALYQREVRQSLYPRDLKHDVFDGVDPVRLFFVGDVAVSGHGVLSHGLTVASRTAERIAAESGRGATWSSVASPDLTISKLVARGTLGAEAVEVAYVALGIPDVLLITEPDDWARDLETLVVRIQEESGLRACRVLVSGIPPMSDFRPIRPAVRRVINRQVERLNLASAEVANAVPGVTYVAFPTWRIGDMYIQQSFSWRTMHDAWAETLAAALRD
jgi:hypothetical protein